MKYAILVILAVAAALGVTMYVQNPQGSLPVLIEEPQLADADVKAHAEIEAAADVLQAQDVDPAESIAEMEVTAYTPDLEELRYTDEAGNEHVFKVEVVSKLAEVQKGLMFRHDMPENQGMLFVFPAEAERGFWMKNTYIPLDMFFMKSDGTIVKVHKGAIPRDLTVIYSEGKAQYVLEVNAGVADKFGIKAGDKFHHEIFINKLAE